MISWFLALQYGETVSSKGEFEINGNIIGTTILLILTSYSFIGQPCPEIAVYMPNDQFNPFLSGHYQRALLQIVLIATIY